MSNGGKKKWVKILTPVFFLTPGGGVLLWSAFQWKSDIIVTPAIIDENYKLIVKVNYKDESNVTAWQDVGGADPSL